MAVSATMKQELQWGIDNVYSQRKVIVAANPEVIITSDASLEGRGCSCLNEKTGGRWNEKEKQWHINYLELLGAFHALQSFQDKLVDKHVQLLLDNTTAVAYVNHMGGKQPSLNDLARTLWSWCLAKNIWLSAAHIPGVNNGDADFESRHFNDRCEWSLDNRVFHNLTQIFGLMDIDLFASRLNAKCQRYVAWRRDPQAESIDAFSRSWSDFYAYIFPPFSLIGRCLQKLRHDQGSACVIVANPAVVCPIPGTVGQATCSVTTTSQSANLRIQSEAAPSQRKTDPDTGHVSGKHSDNLRFQRGLQKSCSVPGNQGLTNNTVFTSANGTTFALKGRLIVLNQMLLKC